MTSEETREKKITRTMEKVVMSFMYLLFGFMFLGVAFSRELSGLFVVVPLGAFSIGLTKWGLKWQNDRYLRSAKNVDDIQDCLLYTSPSPRDRLLSRMPSSA